MRPSSVLLTKFTEVAQRMANAQVALLCPGQGSQYIGMGKALYESSKASENLYSLAEETLEIPLKAIMFESSEENLRKTKNAQPAIYTHTIATYHTLERHLEECPIPNLKSRIKYILGHSLGEFSALAIDNQWSFQEGLKIVRKRGELMTSCFPVATGMMAIYLSETHKNLNAIQAVLEEEEEIFADTNHIVDIANINSPFQVVLSGSMELLTRVTSRLKRDDLIRRATLLQNVGAPFHSRYMDVNELSIMLQQFQRIPFRVVSNVSARPFDEKWRNDVIAQASTAVRWADSIDFCLNNGISMFLELGPGEVLTKLLRQYVPSHVQCL